MHSKALQVAGSDPVARAPHLLAGARPGDFAAATTLVDAAERTRGSAPDDAARLATRAIELASPEVPEWTELAARAVGVLAETGHDREAIALTDRVIARAPATAVLVRAEVSIAMPLWRLGLLETMRSRAWQILGSTDLSERDRARLIAVAVLADSRSGDVETARAAVNKVLADARRAEDDEGERLARWASVEIAGLEGCYPVSGDLLGCSADLESAWKSAQAKLAALPEDRLAAGNLRVRLAWIAFLRGDLRALEKQIRLAQRLPLNEDPAWPTALLMLQTVLAVAREDSRAVDLARQVDQDGAVHRTRWLPEWQMLVARVARASGDSPLARRSVSMARTFAERNSGLAVPAAVHAHITGLATNDLVELRQAVDTLRPVDRPLLLATALADYGEALLGAGSRAEGLAALDQAAGLYHEVGAQGELRRLYPVVRAAGARRRWAPATHRPETGWGALTGAERRVADLVADGHSNKSAATELFSRPTPSPPTCGPCSGSWASAPGCSWPGLSPLSANDLTWIDERRPPRASGHIAASDERAPRVQCRRSDSAVVTRRPQQSSRETGPFQRPDLCIPRPTGRSACAVCVRRLPERPQAEPETLRAIGRGHSPPRAIAASQPGDLLSELSPAPRGQSHRRTRSSAARCDGVKGGRRTRHS